MADHLDEDRREARKIVIDELRTLAEQAGVLEAADIILESVDKLVAAERAEASAEARRDGYLEAQANFSTEGP